MIERKVIKDLEGEKTERQDQTLLLSINVTEIVFFSIENNISKQKVN